MTLEKVRPDTLADGDTYLPRPAAAKRIAGEWGYRHRRNKWVLKVTGDYDEVADVLESFDVWLNGRSSLNWNHNTKIQRRGNGYAVRLHDTDVLRYLPGPLVQVATGGWPTQTTNDRIGLFLPPGWNSYTGYWDEPRRKTPWVIRSADVDFTFRERMIIDLKDEIEVDPGLPNAFVYSWPKGFHRDPDFGDRSPRVGPISHPGAWA